jgi:hypothetical protein
MRLTFISGDRAVYINGVSYSDIDLSSCGIPSDVHALQWYDTYGEIELKRSFVNGRMFQEENQVITELPVWINLCVTKWEEAKAAEEAAIEAARLAAEEAARLAAEEAAAVQTTSNSESVSQTS